MLPSWARDTITVIRPKWVTERGKRIPDYERGERIQVDGCSVQPAGTEETLAGRQASTVRLTVYAPPGTLIGPHDAVEVDAIRYRAAGAGQAWRSPTGAVSHVIASLVDWEG